jgi:hypothetical protein
VIGRDHLIFAGDILDLGFHPLECMEVLLNENAELLWGNHDLAIILNKPISPISDYDVPVYDMLRSISHKFKVAACCGDILITHAGLSEKFHNACSDLLCLNFFNGDNYNLPALLAAKLNSMDLEDLWTPTGPLWYRPSLSNIPLGVRQIVGHTPPEWIPNFSDFYTVDPHNEFYSVDPYCKGDSFGQGRYRYALIENNNITIIDSND